MEVVSEANRYVVNQACAEAHLGHHVLSCDTKCFRKTKSLAFLFSSFLLTRERWEKDSFLFSDFLLLAFPFPLSASQEDE